MRQQWNRPLALMLVAVMLLGLLPTAAFAVVVETGEATTAAAPAAITLDDITCQLG